MGGIGEALPSESHRKDQAAMNNISKLLSIIILAIIPSISYGQAINIAPNPSHLSTINVTLYDDNNNSSKWQLPVLHKTIDKSFWTVILLSYISTAIDNENSHYAMMNSKYGRELNPIYFAKRPSRARMYEISMPITTLSNYMAYRAKRIEDAEIAFGMKVRGPRWWMYNVVTIGSHVGGAAFTVAMSGR